MTRPSTVLGYAARTLLTLSATTALLILLMLAWGLRPPLPRLGEALTASTAATAAEQLVVLITWVAVVGCLLSGLKRTFRVTSASPPGRSNTVARLERLLTACPTPRMSRPRPSPHLASAEPYPLIIQPSDSLNPCQPSFLAVTEPEHKPMPASKETYAISLLGPLRIQGARQRGRRLRSLTTQLLLYLALHPEGANVEKLADTLLPDIQIEQARNRLWQSATEARRIFSDHFHRDKDGRYQLDRTAIRIDVDELNQLLGDNPAGNEIAKLEQALSLFHGEPLPDTDWPWVDGHVRHLRATYVTLLEQVGRARLLAGDPPAALAAAERALQLDQLNEALWRLAMEADSAAGLRESVNRRYERLKALLQNQLGLEPDSNTRHTYHRLLSQE